MRRLDSKLFGDAVDALLDGGAVVDDDLVLKAQLRLPVREFSDPALSSIHAEIGDAYAACRKSVFDVVDRTLGASATPESDVVLGELPATAPAHTGVTVALVIPRHVADRIAVADGEDPASMHVTLGYYGKVGQDLTQEQAGMIDVAVRGFSTAYDPLVGKLAGVGRFSASETSEGRDVVYASVDSPGLFDFRRVLVERIRVASGLTPLATHGFTPHATIAYVDVEAPTPIRRLLATPVVFTDVLFAAGGEHRKYPLGASVAKSDPTPSAKPPDTSWFDALEALPKDVDAAGAAAASSCDFALDVPWVASALSAMELLLVSDEEVIPNPILLSEHPDEEGSLLAQPLRRNLAALPPTKLALLYIAAALHGTWSDSTRTYSVDVGAPSTDLGEVAIVALMDAAELSVTDDTRAVLERRLREFAHMLAERLNDANRGEPILNLAVQLGAGGVCSKNEVAKMAKLNPDFGLAAERVA